jgi:pantothenate kinase-related protein Tda10
MLHWLQDARTRRLAERILSKVQDQHTNWRWRQQSEHAIIAALWIGYQAGRTELLSSKKRRGHQVAPMHWLRELTR